ncbi:GIY-YIG nuclease family protein [Paenibacillus sp. SC116]|uniref:GIY-YIG nuclease family protein n=1 Tax=Paenibacillus sp. SC116 TaxID=2968986 RepID=UPI00215A8ED0|nr:GIY-YIG nuclease family protein [Paenibacillus sp. SC116]MCR8843146.1 GIY-YIG nuclease family protein [Paenibacillus sp. SC116]
MITIELPKMDFDIQVEGESAPSGNDKAIYDRLYKMMAAVIPWKRGGVYFLCTEEGPVYIGRSINMNQRISTHLSGNEASTSSHSGKINRVYGFFENNIGNQEIYESYAIQLHQPKLNKAKTQRIRGNYKKAQYLHVQVRVHGNHRLGNHGTN